MKKILLSVFLLVVFFACKKNNITTPVVFPSFTLVGVTINNVPYTNSSLYNVNFNPVIKISFSASVDTSLVAKNIFFTGGGAYLPFNYSFNNNDTILIIQPDSTLNPLSNYMVSILSGLKSTSDSALKTNDYIYFATMNDTSNKFPLISDSALLTLIQQQTFNYFWENANPVSYMARERNSDPVTDATGGTGFGVMATLVGVQRNFISRAEALNHISTLVNFLSDTTKVTRYHGAFSHWINGATGATIPFSTQDNGGDIVETSYMMEGFLCARQYFNSTTDSNEINLRNNINTLWNDVDWNWYRNNGQNVLYWNWSPEYNFYINVQVQGWCEALITYVLAASSNTNPIPNIVYTNGWAQNGNMKNGNSYYGIQLPLGPAYGGPLFFAHYSFLGIDPTNLTDAYANYWTQDSAHALINYTYCVNNPGHYNGYGSNCWGLTASDADGGYNASSPTNDVGVIAPTAAVSSLPYTPVQSMNAIRFFYYKLGNKIWGQYGFVDAFNLTNLWFDNDYLAIDQGPQIVMIENYRSGMIWNLFMSCPEVQQGMKNLGFQSPHF